MRKTYEKPTIEVVQYNFDVTANPSNEAEKSVFDWFDPNKN